MAHDREPFKSLRNAAKWNDRRNLERETLRIDPTDKLFFISMAFIVQWRDFINVTPDPIPHNEINNLPLLLEENSEGRRLMNPELVPLRDFQVVSEKSWNLLKGFYGGGPAVSEDDIPRNRPEYELLWEKIQNCRNYVVAHNQHEDFAVKSGTRREKELGAIATQFARAVSGSEDGDDDGEDIDDIEEGDDAYDEPEEDE
ncbi:UNVERIFIED_CONTAM: hypothetical protein HDU68_009450 [Siphonaria sp. JEL0065]|nr:hypothetical protein HDU68_009450 [Siphonaria sp. JEL0065]